MFNILAPSMSHDVDADSAIIPHQTACILPTGNVGFSAQYLSTLRNMLFRANTSFLATASSITLSFPGERMADKRLAGYLADAFFVLIRLRGLYASGGDRYFDLNDATSRHMEPNVSHLNISAFLTTTRFSIEMTPCL